MIEHIVRNGTCPSFDEIGAAMCPPVQKSRVRELVGQLVHEGIVERVPGKKRSFRVRDVTRSRMILDDVLRNLGWSVAAPLGELRNPRPNEQLPMLPAFKHLPDV